MRWIRSLIALGLGMACALGLADVTSAEDEAPRAAAELQFTTARAGASTGTTLDIDYVNPGDPAAKPPAVREVTVRLPRGARFDTTIPGVCDATDEQLMTMGAAACPADSQVGTGSVTIDSGLPEPARFLAADVTFFNAPKALIYLNTVRGTTARTVIRAQVKRREIITPSAMLPGTPPDGGAVDVVHIENPALSTDAGNYVTTPRRCPRRGRWISRFFFTYSDGSTQTVKSPTPCRPSKR